ncbi:bifunctional 3,4-dihydroxy-2-butanone-4-phosphate synthase/GTP cyclohydrolase II [Streptomyces alkaliterrae]|uniref:Riboflavin biosynthesis protein RibBA n=1 Tax=Streptomyces alkaliterrae TaxID=2213162 RepID=A0A5P0YUG3_9ACTN|nr:bifunctional 3,4-dihydroxy-2-butanone-4-phosphate synthase/GTP cyclohydrolase II [Streptomyces alkaliterrae]MBB1255220.1 bifunctional 3,4-dihydroxy-2-butanone-4-phosphate synthase/GTP cyclohydrolase II [Streptomyces alkaliterrae]MBB1258915.1 bifunctional 3,4-dihydroxy-2-butanone-4-phosphate synthase/GTP cyclohydrolase II [Streptomyces alkaliterrae]MQS03928.1 bifunctional 3,4-dihydroxy-2-butanone-4-phosphate synthase/GTP cyclohydrolase II [Streptomyces alkaliterrae]
MTALSSLRQSVAELSSEDLTLDPIERAIADIAAGRPVVVVDDEDRENEGDLVVAAEKATPEIIAFMMSECRGLICVPMEGPELDRLGLPQMVGRNTESMSTAFTVSVDASAAHGVSTGISAADRATTIALLADATAVADDFVRPGHVFPLRAREGGVLVRQGHTEAGVDLARLAGLRPAAAIVEIADRDGTMMRLPRLVPFAREHGLAIVSIADLVEYRRAREAAESTGPAEQGSEPAARPVELPAVLREAETRLPTAYGEFRAFGYRSTSDGVEHIALVAGDVEDGEDVLVRMHSECLTGDILASHRCDCGPQLAESLRRIQAEGRGVLVYLRGHEGRGIGLLPKLRAYELQERGRDTLDANVELGLPADARDYAAGARILTDLGVRSLRLLTNNPEKARALGEHGLFVTAREAVAVQAGEHNLHYLRTKRDRMGHDLPWLEEVTEVAGPHLSAALSACRG